MTKLMLLEWRKLNRLTVISEIIIYSVILMLLPTFFIKVILPDMGHSYATAIELNGFIQMGFILMGGSLINHVFIEEYKNKTMALAFSYPISRKKLFAAKVLFIACFVFVLTLCSFILSGVATYIINQFNHMIDGPLTSSDIMDYLGTTVIRSVAITLMSFAPLLLFGIWKRAVVPLIICSIFSMQLPNFAQFFGVKPDLVVIVFAVLGAISIWLSIQLSEQLGET
ncbi:bacitracin ABC transporter permease [Paenibacillus montaniterrae]|uniref:Bacitracin ABC transporter permease n=1 Tax=Paenibacillus montaniterrae TaxID=429341 RepID=A0A919YSG3_9BACL|nr:ABC transporter permease [Paenibacillus montaniterrae]GIP16083.1 bacitracin ABC transporter permease [Paenibacillus montaniterrae]